MICFHFTIFVVLTTTTASRQDVLLLLWFAFILLSLSYWQQHERTRRHPTYRCDLLSFYYLCRTDNNLARCVYGHVQVVICFHFTIFVVLTTTWTNQSIPLCKLWFAFILLSLSYWQQPVGVREQARQCCDLLSFYYLCRTDNNIRTLSMLEIPVVICFHFTIFVVLTTTFGTTQYWTCCCDLLSFYYLCRTDNNGHHVEELGMVVVICFHFTIFVVLTTTGGDR